MAEEMNPVDLQKREILSSTQSITKLQERVERLEAENREYKEKYEDVSKQYKDEKENYDDVVSLLKDDIAKLTVQNLQLESDVSMKVRKIEENEEISRHQLEQKTIEWEAEKNGFIDRYKTLEVKYNLIIEFEREKANLEADTKKLKEDLDSERKDKIRMLADKDREKVQATDGLKKDMLHKIQETKTSLLSLRKEQLKTTTRLTVLQNHQLTTELEYQSKQTEKLLFKNAKLQEQVTTLKRDVEIHKQVEAELAKRSHYSQNLIKKLTDRIKELEEDNRNNNRAISTPRNEKSDEQEPSDNKGKDEIISFLEKNLEMTEKKLAKVQNDYDILKNEYELMELNLEASHNKYTNAAVLLKENLDNLLRRDGQADEGLDAARRLNLDITDIKEKPFEELNTLQKQMLLNVLLEQIRPYLNKKMLANRLYELEKADNLAQNLSPTPNQASKGNLIDGATILPNIYEKSLESRLDKNKFHDVPLDVSAKIVQSTLRDWGKAVSMPSVKNTKYKYKL